MQNNDSKVIIAHQDIAIFRRIQNGNKDGLRDLFDKYYLSLCEFALYITKSKELSEEVVSEVFTKLWLKRNQITIDKNIKSYLFISTKNLAISYLRKNNNQIIYFGDDHFADIQSNCNPEKKIIMKEKVNSIEELIERIPERSRQIFKMNRFGSLKYREIAEVLNVSVKTVEKHMSKALLFLRDHNLNKKNAPTKRGN